MTKISHLLDEGPTLSFEFFPPKTEKGDRRLRATMEELAPLDPSFISVTYGAGGSTRQRTAQIVKEVHREGRLMPMPHLTCIAHRRAELVDLVKGYRDAGLRNILALHGDPPRDQPDIEQGDLRLAAELVDLVRETGDFCVGVAAHPEGHPLAPDRAADRTHQAAKLKVADFAITQFFFRVEDYLRFVDDMMRRGVSTPIIPGVIPITDAQQVQRFAAMSGADFPAELAERLEGQDAEEVRRIGVDVATALSRQLLDAGAPGLHLYTLNRSEACLEICDSLWASVA